MRAPSLAGGSNLLLVAGILTVTFGLIAAGLSLVDPEPLPKEAVAGSFRPTRTVLLGPAAFPRTGGGHGSGTPACHGENSPAPRPGTPVNASGHDEPGRYLSKMAALQRRRRVATATALDPYQASLHPAVYLANAATPIDDEGSAAR
jgi:hypothetical protein